MSRLERKYKEIIKTKITKILNIKNRMCIPMIQKVVISSSSKEIIYSSKKLKSVFQDIFCITGQKPLITKAKKSISSFKLRSGMNIGVKVTLRRKIMYEFIDRLVNIVLPRVKDFRGLSMKNFDGNGNYSIGIKEQIIFPEINYNKVDSIRGLGIVIKTSVRKDTFAKQLLKLFNFPFID